MSTILQKTLAQNIIKNTRAKQKKNKQELVVSSGYSEMSAKSSAHIILEQKGVQRELRNLGFSEEGAKKVVEEILYNEENEPSDRLKASDMVFKIHGSYAPEKKINATIDLNELQKEITAQIAAFRGLRGGKGLVEPE